MSAELSKRQSAAIDSIVADVIRRLLTLAMVGVLLLFTVLPPYIPAILAGVLFQILVLRTTKKIPRLFFIAGPATGQVFC
jgi:hypothetical protein